jgi:glucan phosphoethanolaminetransferase (alkaline phosphatase superfamily)
MTIGIVLVWVGWLTLDLILYSLFPFVFLFAFDEISTSYKTPFIVVCTLILSIAMVSAQRSNSEKLRWRIWLVVNILIWILASHALEQYWDMIDELVFGDCFPYTQGCLPLAGNETPWWVLFFRP